jgi:hypothetical protein
MKTRTIRSSSGVVLVGVLVLLLFLVYGLSDLVRDYREYGAAIAFRRWNTSPYESRPEVSGWVVDEDGKSVARASVRIASAMLAGPVAYRGDNHATTDEKGAFDFIGGIEKGQPKWVWAWANGLAGPGVRVTPPQGRVMIRLFRHAYLEGVVRGPNGPLKHWKLEFGELLPNPQVDGEWRFRSPEEWAKPPVPKQVPRFDYTAITDSSGRYRVVLPSVWEIGLRSPPQFVELVPGQTTTHDFTVTAEQATSP